MIRRTLRSRRWTLLGGMAAAASVAAAHLYPSRSANADHSLDDLDFALRVITDRNRQSAAEIGWAYIRQRGDMVSSELLGREISDALIASRQASVDRLAVKDRLHRLVREEFGNEGVVYVDKWMLSQTEARLYALSALRREW